MRKKFNLAFLMLFYLGLCTHAYAQEEFYLLPHESSQALDAILKNIDQSKNSIKITIYNFTHKKIADRLKNAARRGVTVEIIFDERSANEQQEKSMLYYLAKYNNITVYKLQGNPSKDKHYHGIMHLKTALFDQNRVYFGSANWTQSAFSNNYELVYFLNDYAVSKKFDRYFEEMKKKSTLFK